MAFYPDWADRVVQDLEDYLPNRFYIGQYSLQNDEVLKARIEAPPGSWDDFMDIIDFLEDNHPVSVSYKDKYATDSGIGLIIFHDPHGLL